jgi:hypothetical protein
LATTAEIELDRRLLAEAAVAGARALRAAQGAGRRLRAARTVDRFLEKRLRESDALLVDHPRVSRTR